MIAIPTRQIVTDSNEAMRSPLLFAGVPDKFIHPPFKLDDGDYALLGLEMWCPVEFKTLPDLAACCAQRRKHFRKQLMGLSRWAHSHVVIGGTIEDIVKGRHGTKVQTRSILGTLATYATMFTKICFHFTTMDKTIAASWVRELLVKGEQSFEHANNPELELVGGDEEDGRKEEEAIRGRVEKES